VKHFRHQDRLTGEDEYYLTTLESVVEFIHGIQPSDLKIDKTEYYQSDCSGDFFTYKFTKQFINQIHIFPFI
jgi:hypothetical protein